ncbi:MAG: hypothetical protein E7Y34_02265 [Mycoplasma sp.]|nr:hypothetical protein [Mycoplasma sp.]
MTKDHQEYFKLQISSQITKLERIDFLNLRVIYLPIIGYKSICLYEWFLDINYLAIESFNQDRSYAVEDTLKNLNFSKKEFDEALRYLEAIGLCSTYKHNKLNEYIYQLHPPLNTKKFTHLDWRKKLLVSKVSFDLLEQLGNLNKNKDISFDKSEFDNVTTKFQDLFSLNKLQFLIDDSYTLDLEQVKDINEAFSLDSKDFILYLTNKKALNSIVLTIKKLNNKGLSYRAINHVIHYVYQTNNGLINSKYILKIGQSFLNKNLLLPEKIKAELENALKNKNNKLQNFETQTIDLNDEKNKEFSEEFEKLWNNPSDFFKI